MIEIMIVGAVDLARGALAAVLGHEDGFAVTAELAFDDGMFAAARARPPAVIVLDADQYGGEVTVAVRRLAVEVPRSRVLMLTGHRTPEALQEALAAGVWGLVGPDTSPAGLVRSVRQVVAGERVIGADLAVAALRPTANPLTAQERAVLRAAGDGRSTQEIAQRLFLAPGTVRNYVSTAIRKTGSRNRLEAVHRARQAGWL